MRKLQRRIVKATHKTASKGRRIVQANAPKAWGHLGDGVVSVNLPTGSQIIATAPHSAAVEVGSRPHMPPLGPIIAWVKLRGMQGLRRKASGAQKHIAGWIRSIGEEYGSVRDATPVDAPEQIAWAIAMAIKKRGTKPTWFVRNSVPAVVSLLDSTMKEMLEGTRLAPDTDTPEEAPRAKRPFVDRPRDPSTGRWLTAGPK